MPMPAPESLEENNRHTLAGNWTDDDPQVIDALFESDADPLTPDELPQARRPAPLTQPRQATRLMTGSLRIYPTWDAQLILPADTGRLSIQLWAASDTPADYVRVSDDSGKLQAAPSAALLYSGQELAFPGAHTGPLWVSCPDAVGPVTVSYISVTR